MEIHNSYIFIKSKNQEDSFYYFLKNSKIELLSDSSAFSFVFKCIFLKSSSKSPYYYFNSEKKTENITEIIIKCLLINDRENNTSDDDHYWNYKRESGKKSKRHFEIKKRFIEEIRIQKELSKNTYYSFNRNVPIVLYSDIFENNFSKNFNSLYFCLKNMENNYTVNQMLNEYDNKTEKYNKKNKTWVDCFKCFSCCFKNENKNNEIKYYFGIIAMEYIPSNYKTFCELIKPIIYEIKEKHENHNIYKYDSLSLSQKSNYLRLLYNIARYDIYRLAIDTGYSQGDFHTDNILMDIELLRSIIIDFGKAKKINNDDNILSLPIKKNFNNLQIILERIFYTTFHDDSRGDEFMWLKNIDEYDYDIILFLDENRRRANG
jgi:hypothetical protein